MGYLRRIAAITTMVVARGGAIALLVTAVAGCAQLGVRTARQPDPPAPAPTQTPWIIERTVEVTRIVEVVATPTRLPPTAEPTPVRLSDLPGTKDLSIIPRPPDSAITRYATTRKLLFLDYSVTPEGMSASELAEYYSASMENYGWELTRLENEGDRFSLTFGAGRDAPELVRDVDYVRVIVKGDIDQISIVLSTKQDVDNWDAFLSS